MRGCSCAVDLNPAVRCCCCVQCASELCALFGAAAHVSRLRQQQQQQQTRLWRQDRSLEQRRWWIRCHYSRLPTRRVLLFSKEASGWCSTSCIWVVLLLVQHHTDTMFRCFRSCCGFLPTFPFSLLPHVHATPIYMCGRVSAETGTHSPHGGVHSGVTGRGRPINALGLLQVECGVKELTHAASC